VSEAAGGQQNQNERLTGTYAVKTGFAEMFKGGVIMDVVTADQARIAEQAGAVAVMALERVPADIRSQGGVARMSDPGLIEEIIAAVSIPVMAKVRIGHFVEAQILQHLGVDFIDESEVLTPADEAYHIDKRAFTVPFVCGATNIGEALRRIGEGAAMIRTKGEAGTGNVVEAVRHARSVIGEIRAIQAMAAEQLMTYAKDNGAPYELVRYVHEHGKLPVVNFAAGGVATPADAALMMQLGVDGVFVGSGIFKAAASEPDEARRHAAWARRAEAIVKAVTHFNDPAILAEVSKNLGEAMVGIGMEELAEDQLLARRGW
jgi:pyridoxal 5'-phosphate synthase pdxS subunit